MFGKLKEFFGVKKPMEYKCSCCGKTHANWPALGYNSPDHYSYLSDDDKKGNAELTSDTCIINYPDRVDRFVRGVLKIPVQNTCRHLEYGIWVSLSEQNFYDYLDNLDNESRSGGYFGWVCNTIYGYDKSLSIPSDVLVQPNGYRPLIVPHESHDHPVVIDFYNGISIAEAEKRINAVIQKTR